MPLTNSSIDPRVDIGHVHLKVSNLDRVLDGASDHGEIEAIPAKHKDAEAFDSF